MFKKEEKILDKINEKDVGLAEDIFEAIKQSCGIETHAYGNLISDTNLKNLELYNNCRKDRTLLMELCIKKLGCDLKNQDWCKIKHICSLAMHLQEVSARCSMLGDIESVTKLTDMHKSLYLQFLMIMGVNENNISSPTSA